MFKSNVQFISIFYKKYSRVAFIFPFPHVLIAERIMKKNYAKLTNKKANIDIIGHDVKKLSKMIESYHYKEYKRKEQIEDKAKTSLFIITLSLTFILSSLTFIYTNQWLIPREIILLSLIIGVVFLILSGITAIKSLSVTEYNDIYLDGRVTGDYNKLQIINISEKEELDLLYECVKLNEIITTIKENYYFATITGIRNGIFFITIFFILGAINFILLS